MEKHAQKAFDALKKIGAPVIERTEGGGDHFIISGEDNATEIWADYYDEFGIGNFGVSKKIQKILDKYGLYAEWYCPGFLCVYNA